MSQENVVAKTDWQENTKRGDSGWVTVRRRSGRQCVRGENGQIQTSNKFSVLEEEDVQVEKEDVRYLLVGDS